MPDEPKSQTESKSLIAFLTGTLKKLEHHERAQQVLVEVAEDREVTPQPHFYKRLGALWLIMLLALALLYSHYRKPHFEVSHIDFGIFAFPILNGVKIGGETEEELWFLGLGEGTETEQKLKLHQSEPDNVLYYFHYVEAYQSEHETFPPDHAETIARLDVDNAFWDFYAAAKLAKEACEHLDYIGEREEPIEVDGRRIRPPARPKTYEVLNADLFEQALVQVERGCAKPENINFMNRHIARVNEIYDRLAPNPTLPETVTRVVQHFRYTSSSLRLRQISRLMSAALYQAGQDKDLAQFQRIAALREAFMLEISDKFDDMLVGALVYRAIASETAVQLRHTCEVLGLEEEAAHYQAEAEQLEALNNARRSRSLEDHLELDPRMGILHQESMPVLARQVANPPNYEIDDFRALRMVEHELVSQWLSMILCGVLLLLTLPVFLMRFLFGRATRTPATRVARMLRPKDWLRIFGWGLALPVAVHALLTWFTPLGGRGYGIGGLGYAYPALPLLTLLLCMWIASSITIRRCLQERLSISPASKRQTLTSRIYLGLVLAIYVLGFLWLSLTTGPIGMYAITESAITLLWWHGILLGLLFIWSLWIRVRGTHAERFHMLASSSALIPCIPVAITCLCVLLPLHLAGEKRWMARDTTLLFNPTKTVYGVYEGKVTVESYRETNEILFPEGAE